MSKRDYKDIYRGEQMKVLIDRWLAGEDFDEVTQTRIPHMLRVFAYNIDYEDKEKLAAKTQEKETSNERTV